MIRLYPNEIFREVEIDYSLQNRYAVSNRGRLVSYTEKFEDGTLLKGGLSQGYRTLRYKAKKNGRTVDKSLFIYKLVAQLFIGKEDESQQYVIHLDYSRDNDIVSNLKWATYAEMLAHRKTNPKVINIKHKISAYKLTADGAKLSVTKVMHLKKILADPKRKTRLKILAKQFGISEMQVSRIKSGANWGHIKV
jgi:hypothetical protein